MNEYIPKQDPIWLVFDLCNGGKPSVCMVVLNKEGSFGAYQVSTKNEVQR